MAAGPRAGHGPPGHAHERHGPTDPPAGAAHGVAPLSRTRRTPLQYLLGTQGFYGLEIRTDARALIPRQETETLCETGIAHLRALGPLPPPAVLDLCTGSGAIALALRHECPFAQVSASDASAEALSLARENARRLGLSVDFFAGDLFDAVGERRFDLILSNPPYIPSDECARAAAGGDPRAAHGAGRRRGRAGFLPPHRPRGARAPDRARHAGRGGGRRQAPAVAALFEAAGLRGVEAVSDLYGHARVVRAYAAGHL